MRAAFFACLSAGKSHLFNSAHSVAQVHYEFALACNNYFPTMLCALVSVWISLSRFSYLC